MAINRDKILRDAEKLVQKGKVEQAIREYEKLLKANPNEANTINRVGDLYGRIGQIDKAIELYERIADHFTQDGFTTKAIAILKKINRLAPQRLDIFERLAELYLQQGLVVEAKNQYQILADWYSRNDDLDNAIEAHRKLVQLDPGNHMAHLRLADLLLESGKADEAIDVYDRLGRMLLEREKLDEAERLYRHAMEQNPPSGEFLAPLCEALLAAGRTTVAREFLEAALERSPDNFDLQVLEVRALLALGNAKRALDTANKVLAAAPENDEVRLLVGKALLSVGEAQQAREILLPAAERSLKLGDFVNAQTVLQDLIKAMPQDTAVLSVSLRAFGHSGDEEMIFTLKAALADSKFRTGRKEAATKLYTELLESDPQNNLFRQRLAQLAGGAAGAMADEAAAAEAAAVVELDVEPEMEELDFDMPPEEVELDAEPEPEPVVEAVEAAPAAAAADFDPTERMAEATVFAKYGLVEKAVRHLESILESFPETIEAREKLVLLFVEQGQTERAEPIARPLLEHYRQEGNQEGIKTLLGAVPSLDAAGGPAAAAAQAPAPQPVAMAEPEPVAATETSDEVIIVDLDSDDLAGAPEYVDVDQTAQSLDEAGAIAFDDGEGELVEIDEVDELSATDEDLVVLDAEEEIPDVMVVDDEEALVDLDAAPTDQAMDVMGDTGVYGDDDAQVIGEWDEPEVIDDDVAMAPVEAEQLEPEAVEFDAPPEPVDFGAPPEDVEEFGAPEFQEPAVAEDLEYAQPEMAEELEYAQPEVVEELEYAQPEVVEEPEYAQPAVAEEPELVEPVVEDEPEFGEPAGGEMELEEFPADEGGFEAQEYPEYGEGQLEEFEEPEPLPEETPEVEKKRPVFPAASASQSAIMELESLERAVLSQLHSKGRRAEPQAAEPAVEEPAVAETPMAPEPEVPEPAPMADPEVVEEMAPGPVPIFDSIADEVEADDELVAAEAPVQDELVEISDTVDGPSLDDLQQIDFFIQQELYEDAVRVLDQLESAYPNDPEVAQRRLQLKTKGVLLEDVAAAAEEAPEDLFADEEEYFDLARELEEEMAEEEALVEEAAGRSQGETELEEVFREFQKGVAEQLSEEDSDTHFNLGIAYREMGLLPEAIREFQVASRDAGFFVECCSMIAVCYLEQGMSPQAAEWYRKALTAPDLPAEARLALRYDLASALELAGDLSEAADVFSDIATADPAFRDVEDRLSQLGAQRHAN